MTRERQADERTNEPESTGKALKRRGILAAAGAVVAGIVAKQASEPVGATHQIEDLGLGLLNYASATTRLAYTGTALTSDHILTVKDTDYSTNFPTPAAALSGQALAAQALQNDRVNTGVYGLTTSTASGAAGVSGQHLFNGNGVYGTGGNGVRGVSTQFGGNGVFGTATNGTTAYGVLGTSTGGKGVFGGADTGTGVYGNSTGGNGVFGYANAAGTSSIVAGVYGSSATTYGIIGNTTAAGYSGLTAITSTPNVAALGATSTVATAYAAFFTGTTVVNGNFVATGGTKSAAVKDASGQHRLVYCVESPESWFEDFGEAKLVNGKAEVVLEKTFAEIVHTDTYHVFLTEAGGTHHHLSVERKSGTGFTVLADAEVAALKGKKTTDLTGTFSYRVVAKRKDIVGERLAKWEMPKINHPDPDKLPKPELPKPDPTKKP